MMPLLILSLFTQEGDQNCRSVIVPYLIELKSIEQRTHFPVVTADGLAKPDDSSLPDPFAVIIVDSEQTHTTGVIKQTLYPYWNEHFDVSVVLFQIRPVLGF